MKFSAFVAIMGILTVLLVIAFTNYRGGNTVSYAALFEDVSQLKAGDTVRAAGIEVGTVKKVTLQADHKVHVTFDVNSAVPLTMGTRASVRYLNLVGDRFLELSNAPGSTDIMQPGAEIPPTRTAPALDLDNLLGGLKPVIQGLNPQDVNALSASLLQILQGQQDSLGSLLSNTAAFSGHLADNNKVIEELIESLDTIIATLAHDGANFSGVIDHMQRLVGQLSTQRDPIGVAIDSLDKGTASLTDLLANARSPLAGTVDQLHRLTPLLDEGKASLEASLKRAPENYRKLSRLYSYGSWINAYMCGISVRVSDLAGETAVFPWIRQTTGRCAEP